jgi:hypothetical protein
MAALAYLRDCQATVDCLHAELAAARDARRAAEWHIRAQLAAALARLGGEDDDPDGAGTSTGDNVIDFLLACQLIGQRTGAARVAATEDGCCRNQQRSR